MYELTALERAFMVEQLVAALGECQEAEDVSQEVVDGLVQCLEILGEKYERTHRD